MLVVNCDATAGDRTLAISGTAVIPKIIVEEPVGSERLWGSTIPFGQTARGFASMPVKSLTVRNVSPSALTITAINLTGAESSHFSVTKTRLPLVLAPRASIRIPALFRPLSIGSKSATFVITSNDLDEGTFQLGLTGEGTQPALEFAVGALVDSSLPVHVTSLGTVKVVTGLPRGLKYDAKTGRISGRPAVSGAYTVRVTILGADGKTTIHTMTLYVEAMPAWAVGSFTSMFAGPVLADNTLTGLGGVMSLTGASAGTYSGSLRLGARSFALKGQLDGELEASRGTEPLSSTTTIITNPKDRTQDITLNLEFRPDDHATLPGLTGTLTFQGVNYAIQPGWQHGWNAKTKPAFGNKDRTLNVVIENRDDVNGPQGDSFARVRLTKAGVANWAATLSDGRELTASFTVSPDGDVPFCGAIAYPNGGALSALLATEVSGDLYKVAVGPRANGRWVKRQTSNAKVLDRVYRGGFDVSLGFSGAEYVVPARGVLLFGNPAPAKAMSFTLDGAGITSSGQLPGDDPVTLGAELRLNNVIAVPTQSGLPTTFRIAPGFSSSSGLVTGSIVLSDISSLTTKATPRTLSYQGLYIPNLASPASSRVRGFFTLPELPDAAGETTSNTPIQSGSFSVLAR
jgi:hypothetical protein